MYSSFLNKHRIYLDKNFCLWNISVIYWYFKNKSNAEYQFTKRPQIHFLINHQKILRNLSLYIANKWFVIKLKKQPTLNFWCFDTKFSDTTTVSSKEIFRSQCKWLILVNPGYDIFLDIFLEKKKDYNWNWKEIKSLSFITVHILFLLSLTWHTDLSILKFWIFKITIRGRLTSLWGYKERLKINIYSIKLNFCRNIT